MRADWLWKASTLALAGALVLVVGSNDNVAHADQKQPHMQAALTALETAKAQLEKASSDKGGHRAKAIQHTKEAIEQVKKGILHDKTHGNDKSVDADAAREALAAE